MGKIIKKKIWPEYFDDVASGKKKYELRLNDFEIKEGDILVLEEWNPKIKKYTGRSIEKKVTYVGKFKIDKLFWSKEEILEKGIQIISLKWLFLISNIDSLLSKSLEHRGFVYVPLLKI